MSIGINKTKRNGKIELLRFIFSLIVVCDHLQYVIHSESWGGGLFKNSGVAVEFFFVLSGFLMAKSIAKFKQPSQDIAGETSTYVLSKIKAIFPNYILSFCVVFACYCMTYEIRDVTSCAVTAIKSIPSFFFLQEAGWEKQLVSINGPTWYISAMLISMLIIYPLCRKSRFFNKIGTLIVSILLIGTLQLKFGSLVSPYETFDNIIYKGLVRGFAEICLGVVAFNMHDILLKKQFTQIGIGVFSVIEITCFFIAMYIVIFSQNPGNNIIGLIAITFLIIIAFTGNTAFSKAFNNSLSVYLGRLSLSIYLSHKAVRYFDKYIVKIIDFDWYFKYRLAIVLGSIFVLAIIVDLCSQVLKRVNIGKLLFA